MNNYFKFMSLVLSERLYKLFIICLINTIIPSTKLLEKMLEFVYLRNLKKDIKINSDKLPMIFDTAERISKVHYSTNDTEILRTGLARRLYILTDWLISEMTMSAHKYLTYRTIREHEVFNEF